MDLWLRRCSSFDDEMESDMAFWSTMTPDERVAVVEQMRREWLEQHGDGDERLRRTARRVSAR